MWYMYYMVISREGKILMNKKFTFTTSKDFLDVLSEARWVLKKTQSELIRDAVMEYIERHIPKEVRLKIFKSGRE